MSEETRITDPETGGQKNAKPIRMDLISPAFMEELGRVYHFGTEKYAAHNYRKGYPDSLSLASLYRHLNAYVDGEDNDPESGHSHLAHVAWHCAKILQNRADFGDRFDDRYVRETVERVSTVEQDPDADVPLLEYPEDEEDRVFELIWEGYSFIAFDLDGTVWAFDERPESSSHSWHSEDQYHWLEGVPCSKFYGPNLPPWDKSLRRLA